MTKKMKALAALLATTGLLTAAPAFAQDARRCR